MSADSCWDLFLEQQQFLTGDNPGLVGNWVSHLGCVCVSINSTEEAVCSSKKTSIDILKKIK